MPFSSSPRPSPTSLQSNSLESNNFPIYKEASSFREKEAFREIIELGFLSYYKDFKLLLCSKCFLAINPTTSQPHIVRHILLYTKEELESIVSKALLVFNSLE